MLGEGKCLVSAIHMLGEGKCLVSAIRGFIF